MNTHVTVKLLTDLLDSSLPDAALILVGGTPRVVGSMELEGEAQPFVIVTRDELRDQLPKDREYSESDLEFHAAELESTVASLGG
ncbi:hypothetical protein [Rhodococcus tibetensis]|uniref:Uncharacterized protein n=1 Tax=Rhodococcus tibetensis TaxID=2965064 RepID=A0ABT1QBG3_9NOCA|nr:hypothetical protein [Rhodococcus sp. FXJ9.536]MCQ4118435.1 hypothetical protein [Rhodococcus sp. FXJ9.536]